MEVFFDEMCASGKTTLGYYLKKEFDCNLFHMDDFFLQGYQRTQERLNEIGGNVDYEKMIPYHNVLRFRIFYTEREGKHLKIKWKTLLICIAIPLFVGGLAGFISRDSMSAFSVLNQPPLSPPGWLFPIVWTILYILMGIASYIILTSDAPQENIDKAINLYGLQLLFNFFWTFWFFNLQLYFFSFIWLIALWLLILATIVSFSRISKLAAYLMIPYLLWVTFAGYLNLGIALLN